MLTSDNELLSLYVRENDNEALEQLIRRHSRMVLAVCRSLLWQTEDAEDAFQAVFILLSMKAPKLLRHNSVGGWLHESATRICLQQRRQKARNREVTMVEEPASNNEPWKSIAEARNLEALHREISRLPEKYREVLVLYHFEGKSRSQIASLLDCTAASVKACLARAREQLRQRLLRQGITASLVLACAVAASEKVRADAPLVLDPLIRSTLDHCQGLEPTLDVGNGPKFVESLLAKETSMSIGTIHSLAGSLVGVTLCVAAVAAIAASPQDGAPSSSTGGGQQQILLETATEAVVQGISSGSSAQIRRTDSNLPVDIAAVVAPVEAIAEIHTVTTHRISPEGTSSISVNPYTTFASVTAQASQQLSMLLVKTNGTHVVYSTPQVSTKQVPQKYAAGVKYQENGRTKTRTEQRTRTVQMTTLTGEKVETPMPDGTVFESLDGQILSVDAIVQRIGEGELPVVILGGKQELPSEWKGLLKSDTVIARHDALVGHLAKGRKQIHRVGAAPLNSTP